MSQKTKGTGITGYPTPNVYNVTTHRATGYSPVELLFGHRVRVPSPLQEQPTPRYNYDYVNDLKGPRQAAHAIAWNRLLESKTRSKLYYDRKTVLIALKVGDRALLFDESVQRGRWKKLSAQWIGLYVVLAVDGVKATMKRRRIVIKVHVNRLKPFYWGNEGNSSIPSIRGEKDRKMVIIRDLLLL